MLSLVLERKWTGHLRKLSSIVLKNYDVLAFRNLHLLRSGLHKVILPLSSIRRHISISSSLNTPRKEVDHVNFDTLGTWDNRMELPLQLSESMKHGMPIPKISLTSVGTATNIGRRTTNEDRFTVKELAPDLLYFAIFDGHGGPACADFCNDHMADYISSWLQKGEKDLKKMLETVFLELDIAFSRFISFKRNDHSYVLLHLSDTDGATPGTTATVCLLRNSIELVIGHVGDSRVILCRNGEARKLTIDHSPVLKAEKERIEKSGGRIMQNSSGQILVNGRLAMTRSLGDLELKQYGVICLPDTVMLEVKHGKDAFLILTTDGINCVTSDQEICDTVNRCQEPLEAASFIVDQALQYASDDNATAVVVPFGSWGKFSTSTSHYSFGRNMIRSARFS